MATSINTDYGSNLPWKAWKNGHNAWTINLGIDLSPYAFTLNIYRSDQGGTPKVTLTEGSGLTNGGADETLDIVLTQLQAGTTLAGNDFYYVLSYTYSSKTYRLYEGPLTLSTGNNPGATTTTSSATVTMAGAGGAATTVNSTVTLVNVGGAVPVSDFATELTFDYDKELSTVSGGTRTFTLAASGNQNGVGIVARVNEPVAVNFPAAFEAVNGSDSISTTHMNIIVFRYYEDYDGAGNDKVLYVIKNQDPV